MLLTEMHRIPERRIPTITKSSSIGCKFFNYMPLMVWFVKAFLAYDCWVLLLACSAFICFLTVHKIMTANFFFFNFWLWLEYRSSMLLTEPWFFPHGFISTVTTSYDACCLFIIMISMVSFFKAFLTNAWFFSHLTCPASICNIPNRYSLSTQLLILLLASMIFTEPILFPHGTISTVTTPINVCYLFIIMAFMVYFIKAFLTNAWLICHLTCLASICNVTDRYWHSTHFLFYFGLYFLLLLIGRSTMKLTEMKRIPVRRFSTITISFTSRHFLHYLMPFMIRILYTFITKYCIVINFACHAFIAYFAFSKR